MISETEFGDLGDSLSTGFLVDRIVTTFARIQRVGRAESEARAALLEADTLLERILTGEKWLIDRKLDGNSAESALAFNRAAHALPSIKVSSDFVKHIEQLKKTVNNLLMEGTAPDTDISQVRRFFFRYAKAVLQEAQRVIERSSEPRGIRLWNQQSEKIA